MGTSPISPALSSGITVLRLLVVLVAGCALSLVFIPHAQAQAPRSERIDGFLASLAGQWTGTATTTPLGPLPYDLAFSRCTDNSVHGTANPGAAIHAWTFYRQGAHLRLRFLSTFRGNRDPILLTAESETDEGAMVFRAERPEFLRVLVKVGEANATIQVLHHDRLHVEIYLSRR
jgi:hypothetical protein